MAAHREKGAMVVGDAADAEAETPRVAIAIARRCVYIIQTCLREEEVIDAVREFYSVIREELEKWKASKTA
jgi:hypothetical protein